MDITGLKLCEFQEKIMIDNFFIKLTQFKKTRSIDKFFIPTYIVYFIYCRRLLYTLFS